MARDPRASRNQTRTGIKEVCVHLLLTIWLTMAATLAKGTTLEVGPQAGPQTTFVKHCTSDIAIFGGSAGGGKTYALLLEALRNIHVPTFGAVIFRREYPQIVAEGGLWDTSRQLFFHAQGTPREGIPDWKFPSGSRIRFSHMQRDEDRMAWDGAQIPLICFDQLESFTKKQFFYMLSRNRSNCGVKPYIRATCNPVADHWLKKFVQWWIDDDGWAIPERSGKKRWFIQMGTDMVWGERPELYAKFGPDIAPKSVTFIASSILDNQIFLKANPEYLNTLKSLQFVDRMRLLGDVNNIDRGGNWNIKEGAGNYFKKRWFEIVDAAPADMRRVRYWDRAGTPGADDAQTETGSRTAGVRMGRAANGIYFIEDATVFRGSPNKVEETIKNTATQDGRKVIIGIEQDPGQAGKMEAQYQVRQLAGYDARVNPVHESKGTRAKPFSAQCEAGNVKIVRGPWNEDFLNELENFDGTTKTMADQVDAGSGAFMFLTTAKRTGTWGGDLS